MFSDGSLRATTLRRRSADGRIGPSYLDVRFGFIGTAESLYGEYWTVILVIIV